MERCDATELCGTKADGTTKDTTTMAGENGKAFVTQGKQEQIWSMEQEKMNHLRLHRIFQQFLCLSFS